jgi:hypothetical protein
MLNPRTNQYTNARKNGKEQGSGSVSLAADSVAWKSDLVSIAVEGSVKTRDGPYIVVVGRTPPGSSVALCQKIGPASANNFQVTLSLPDRAT